MIENKISFLRDLSESNRNLGCRELSDIVNPSYARTNDIQESMKETGVSFSEVWEMKGMKDYFDFLETGED